MAQEPSILVQAELGEGLIFRHLVFGQSGGGERVRAIPEQRGEEERASHRTLERSRGDFRAVSRVAAARARLGAAVARDAGVPARGRAPPARATDAAGAPPRGRAG